MMKIPQDLRNFRSTRRSYICHHKVCCDEREVIQGKTENCPVCEKDHHDTEDCPTFLTEPDENRSKTLFKKKLCYGCLAAISKNQNAKK